MDKFKGGVDIYGWVGCLVLVGILWLTCMWESLHDYFIPNAIELTKLVAALLLTAVIWLIYVLVGSRNWQEYGREERQWQADHDLAMIDKMDKLYINKLQDVTNIIGENRDVTALGGEGIGED